MNTRLKEKINAKRAPAQRNGIKRRFLGEASTALPVLARSHGPKKLHGRGQRAGVAILVFLVLGYLQRGALKPL